MGTDGKGRAANEWTEELLAMRALSIRQPRAWLIVNGIKDIENRSRRTKHRGPILIHAGINRSGCTPEKLEAVSTSLGTKLPDEFAFGGIIGVANVVDCQPHHESPWFQPGGFAWVMAEACELPFRPCKGALGFFSPTY